MLYCYKVAGVTEPLADDTAWLIEQIKKLAVVHGKVTPSSGRTPTTTWTSAG